MTFPKFLLSLPFLVIAGGVLPLKTSGQTIPALQLQPGTSRNRQIARGATATYEIKVERGELLSFSIDKGDLTLSTEVYGPNGKSLLLNVSERFETVTLSVPSETGGTYRIELKSREKDDRPREYAIRLECFRLNAVTRRQSEARHAMSNAEVLLADWTESSLRRAIDYYDEAIEGWIASNSLSEASLTAIKVGDVYFMLSNYPEALKRYRNALSLAKKASDRLAEARSLSQIGLIASYMGDNDAAQKYLANAISHLEEVKSDPGVSNTVFAESLCNAAEVSYARGNLVRASIQSDRALKLFQGNRRGQARVHLFSGYIAGSVGDPKKAESEISQALDLFRATDDRLGEALSLTAFGLFHSLKRDEDRAIELHETAIKIAQTLGNHHTEAIALNALGQAYENLNEFSLALNNYQKALTIFQHIHALDLTSVSIFKIAKVHRLMSNFDQALNYYNRGLKLSRAARKFRTEVNALTDIAVVYAIQGRPDKALKQYAKVQAFYKAIGDQRGCAIALNTSGDLLLQLGFFDRALQAYTEALPLSRKSGDKGIVISSLYNLARVYRDLKDYKKALSMIEQSLSLIEELRSNVGSPDFRMSYFSGVKNHYELKIDILMQLDHANPGQGFGSAALLVSEKARARSLIELLNESQADLGAGATPELLARERELKALISSLSRYEMELTLSRKHSAEIVEVGQQMARLRSEYEAVQTKLRDRNARAGSLTRFTPISVERIQVELNDDTLLLEYSLGNEHSYLWAVTASSFASYELPPRKEIERAAGELYKLVTARQRTEGETDAQYQAHVESADSRYMEYAGGFSQMLLGPVAKQLGNKRLILVTEGALQYIPWESLPDPTLVSAGISDSSELLIGNHEIVIQPSISTLVAIRAERARSQSPNRTVVVLADPVFDRRDDRLTNDAPSSTIRAAERPTPSVPLDEPKQRGGGLSRLAHTSEEANVISAAAPRGTTMIAKGFDASRETAMSSQLGEYQIVHFATHGFLDSEHPELSGIVLSMVDRNGVETNGLLALNDICNLRLSAQVTVLSACQTALGKDIKGEGLVGLTHSFLSAGSKSVVSSLWKVDDRATSILMARFYELMLQEGMSPASALRGAKLKLRQQERWSAPYFWAGFVLQGEYSNHIIVERNSRWRVGVPMVLALVVISGALLIIHQRRVRSSGDPLI